MIVDHADGLHVSIHDRAANELEAAMFKVFAEGV
jgi:hypothetical protein